MGDTTISTDVLNAVDEACAEIGTTAYITRESKSTFIDITHPSKGYTTITKTYTVSIVEGSFDDKLIDGDLIREGDKKVLVDLVGIVDELSVPVSNFIPLSTDLFVLNSETWKILMVKPIRISGVNVTAILHVRK